MSDTFNPSAAFTDFFFLAIDHGFNSIEDGDGPLIAFAMLLGTDGKRSLQRFVTEKLEDGAVKAREFVAANQHEFQMYAIAWDGFVTLEGKRSDAILVEAADRAEEIAVLFSQRYVPGKRGLLKKVKAQRIGNPGVIDRPVSLFRKD